MKTRALAVTSLLAFGAVGAGPPREGTQVGVGGGVGEYQFRGGGCGGPAYRYQVDEMQLAGHARMRTGPWAGALEASQGRGEIVSSEVLDARTDTFKPPLANGSMRRHTLFALRGGFHWKYAGAEVGPAVYQNADFHTALVPSAEIWLGVPDIVYAWGTFFAGPWSSPGVPIGLGLGTTHDAFDVQAGVLGENLVLDGSARLLPTLRLGAQLRLSHVSETPGWSAGLSAEYTIGEAP